MAIFVKGLSKQLIPKGIRVNGVAPGPVWTPLQPSGGQSPEKLVNFGGDVRAPRGERIELRERGDPRRDGRASAGVTPRAAPDVRMAPGSTGPAVADRVLSSLLCCD